MKVKQNGRHVDPMNLAVFLSIVVLKKIHRKKKQNRLKMRIKITLMITQKINPTPSHQNQMKIKESLKKEKMVVNLMGAGKNLKMQRKSKHENMRTLGQVLSKQQSYLMMIKFIATDNISMNSLMMVNFTTLWRETKIGSTKKLKNKRNT